MKRKPGETVHELAARIRQDAVTCDFTSTADPLDEALRICFICSISSEVILKAIFKIKDTDLTFAKAIAVATETEDAARVAKETVHGVKNTEIHKINTNALRGSTSKSPRTNAPSSSSPFPKGTCERCGRDNHIGKNCPYINTTCNCCKTKGHLESVCLQKKGAKPRKRVKIIHLETMKMVNTIPQITTVNELQERCRKLCETFPELFKPELGCLSQDGFVILVYQMLVTGWICHFGVPNVLITDRGSQFTLSIWRNVGKILNIKLQQTTAYHPQSNGMIERFHRHLKDALEAK